MATWWNCRAWAKTPVSIARGVQHDRPGKPHCQSVRLGGQIHGGSLLVPLLVSSVWLVSFHPAVSIHRFGLTEECATVHPLYQGPDQLALDMQGSLKL